MPADTRTIALVKQLDRKHEEWSLYSACWDQLETLYEGGVRLQQAAQRFLRKRPKELGDVYQERYSRFTYQNLLANTIGWYQGKLFQTEPIVDPHTTDSRAKAYLQDSNRAGAPFTELGRLIFEQQMLFGRAYVLVDKPRVQDGLAIETRLDEQRAGVDQPYSVIWDPRQVFNWDFDEYGNLKWIVLKAISQTQNDPLSAPTQTADWYVFDRKTVRHFQFRPGSDAPSLDTETFLKNSSSKDSDAASLVDERPHVLAEANRVPVRYLPLPRHLWFANRAYLHLLEHLDQLNGYSWKLFIANHPQLVVKSDSKITGQTLSEVGYLQIPPTDSVEYLEPSGSSFSESREYLKGLREEIYRDFHLQAQGRSSTATASASSGLSKEMDMAPSVDMLNALGDVMRADQQNLLLDWRDAAGIRADPLPDVTGYTFEADPSLAEIEKFEAANNAGVIDKSETLEKTLDTKIALDLVEDQNQQLKDQIAREIQAAPTRKQALEAAQQQEIQQFQQRLKSQSDIDVQDAQREAVAA